MSHIRASSLSMLFRNSLPPSVTIRLMGPKVQIQLFQIALATVIACLSGMASNTANLVKASVITST